MCAKGFNCWQAAGQHIRRGPCVTRFVCVQGNETPKFRWLQQCSQFELVYSSTWMQKYACTSICMYIQNKHVYMWSVLWIHKDIRYLFCISIYIQCIYRYIHGTARHIVFHDLRIQQVLSYDGIYHYHAVPVQCVYLSVLCYRIRLLQDVGSKAEGRRGDSSWGRSCRGGTDLRRVSSHWGPLLLGIVEGVDATRRRGWGERYSGSLRMWWQHWGLGRRAVHCCNRKACTGRGAVPVGRVWGWIRGRAESEPPSGSSPPRIS